MNPVNGSSLLDQLDTGLVQVDRSGRIRFMNSAAEHCFLVSRDRACNRPLADLGGAPPELLAAIAAKQPDNQSVRLGGIRGAAQMLADELNTGELSTLARLIMRESDRIDELIQSFGQPELEWVELDFYPLLGEALDVLEAEFRGSVLIERDYDPSLPPILGDRSAIRQVILNLMRNACQSGATTVRIRTRVEHSTALMQSGKGSVIRLDVIDNGPGVSESLQPLLFLPFVTGRRDGTGLGLALSQQITAAHGGLLTYEALEQGSCFSMYLPFGNGRIPDHEGEEH